jgi:hypothetical protein
VLLLGTASLTCAEATHWPAAGVLPLAAAGIWGGRSSLPLLVPSMLLTSQAGSRVSRKCWDRSSHENCRWRV